MCLKMVEYPTNNIKGLFGIPGQLSYQGSSAGWAKSHIGNVYLHTHLDVISGSQTKLPEGGEIVSYSTH